MKKNFKLALALVLSIMMVMSGMSVLAENTPTNNRTLDSSISLSGLESGDKVNFYQILQFDPNATTTGGWVATTAFAYDATSNANGLNEGLIQKILGLDANGKPVDTTAQSYNAANYGISAGLAAKIADIAEGATATYPNVAATESNGVYTATQSSPTAGLYLALVTPGNASTLYNPIFVGADYDSTNTTNGFTVVELTNSYSPASMAKKSTITLEKTASTTEAAYEDGQPETVAVGDTVTFTVETKIPVYADNYTNAVFTVIDTMSTGLKLDTTSIAVYEGKGNSKTALAATTTKTVDGAEKTITNYTKKNKGETAAIADTDTDGYAVVFGTDYILGDGRGKEITITYNAKVTSAAPTSVNFELNTAEVHFSNSPTDSTGAGKLKDETRHYTFDIDADILGSTGGEWPTTEVVKVGLGPDGKEILERTVTLHTNQTKVAALEGATFKLYYVDANNGTEYKDYTGNTVKLSQYTNDILTANDIIVSDSTGRLDIKKADNTILNGIRGLDIGTYYLVEETAPAGYIRYQNAVKIEIIAPKPTGDATSNAYWELKTYTDNNYLKPWSVWELKKYDVKINGVQTASYTFRNASDTEDTTLHDDTVISTKTDTITGADTAGLIGVGGEAAGYGKIPNTQGVELPSTGGVGTTIFYVAGSFMVLAAAILLITKRRMGAND